MRAPLTTRTALDVLIREAWLVDGTGGPTRRSDIGITAGRVAALGNLEGAEARQIVDAANMVVCPGFIDMHTHSDLSPFLDPRCASKVRQGVTTELVGHCGFSAFPLVGSSSQERATLDRPTMMAAGVSADWSDCAGYLDALQRARPAFNIATLVGNGTVRTAAMGYDGRPPTDDELATMGQLVGEAMEQGAFGLSCGLTLFPSSAARTDELVFLSREVGRRGGFFDTHTRHLAGWHFRSVEEAIEIGRAADVAVQVAHLCIIDPLYWGQVGHILDMLHTTAAEGGDVSFDVYPYTAAGCRFSEAMPDWVQDGGTSAMLERLSDQATRGRLLAEETISWAGGVPLRWDKVVIAWAGPYGDPNWRGKTVEQLAEEAALPPAEMMLQIIEGSHDMGQMIVHNRIEGDVEALLAHPLGMIGSDGIAISADGPWGKNPVHPRFYGSFPRVLSRYVRQRRLMPLEEAIRKMTWLPASRLGLRDRGRLDGGYAADLVVLDPETIQDLATFEEPHRYPIGISHVMVNGQWVVFDGQQTDARPGQVLRHGSGLG